MRRAIHRLLWALCLTACCAWPAAPACAQLNADGVITIGRNALYYEDYALAIQYFNQVIKAKPYLYEPYFYRAVAKYHLGDYHGTVADCDASIERDPFLASCYQLRALGNIMTGHFDLAEKDYRLLIKRHEDTNDTWYNLVLCQTQQQRFASADSTLDVMIGKWPRHARCYMLKAQIALQAGDTLRADSLVGSTLQLDSFNVDALSARAWLLMAREDYAAAEAYYSRAIIQTPRQDGFYINRALARFRQDDLRGAMDDYDIALDIAPDNYLGHYNRGLLCMQVGENNRAIQDFDFVLQQEPRDRLALFNRATLRELTGDYQGAVEDYSTVIEDYPNFSTGYENRARCYRQLGQTKLALADERKVVIDRLDYTYGTRKPKASARTDTRKQKEQNIDDYQKLVINDDEDDIAKFYANDEYRGRIQNREASVEPQPLLILTYRGGERKGIASPRVNEAFVDDINEARVLHGKLYLSSHDASSTADEIRQVDQEAEQLLAQLQQGRPGSLLLFAHAFLSVEQRDFAAAMADLDQAVSNDSAFVAAYFLRGVVRSRQVELQAFKQTDDKALPRSADVVRMDYLPIIADFRHALQLDSASAALHYNLGCVYFKIKDLEQARRHFTLAIDCNPHLAEAYYNRALVATQQGDCEAAFPDFSKAGELGLYSAYSLIKHFRTTTRHSPGL